jgi:hypothetical protein
VIAERMQQELENFRAMGYAPRVTAVFFTLTGDEGATAHVVYMSETTLLQADAEAAATQRAKLSLVAGRRER